MFRDRKEAGKRLSKKLLLFKSENPMVVGLPRGGVVVARSVADALEVPLEIIIVRKIGAPRNPEYAIGAIVEGGYSLFDEEAIERLGITDYEVQQIVEEEQKELVRRVKTYRGEESTPRSLFGKTVILVDDGLATGLTAEVAVGAVLDRGAQKVLFAAPVCAQDSIENLSEKCEIICLESPEGLVAIGNHYQDFSQVTDEEVIKLLENTTREGGRLLKW